MKPRFLFPALLLCLPCLLQAQESKRVLFVGNSYTYVNDLPQMVALAALSVGDTLTYDVNAPGSCTFQQHCSNQSMTLIRQGGWDAVVLQEQSQNPSFPQEQVEAQVFPYAERLVDSIYTHGWCTEPMFYMTWGRRDGDAYNAQFFPPLATYEGMDSLLCERYRQMASDNDASLCPVGRVWRYLRTHHPEIELYQTDGSHPSMAGTYAAACSFYTMLFLRDPEAITYEAGLTDDEARIIRQTVRRVVYDSLPVWQRPLPTLQIIEIDILQFMGCSFDLELIDCDTVTCLWGDGTDTLLTSAGPMTHTYADTGIYTLTLTATRHCISTVVEYIFHATQEPDAGCVPLPSLHPALHPNPATDRVWVGAESDLVLRSLDGRELRRCRADAMPLHGLPAGAYLLSVNGTTYRIIKR